MGRKIKFPLIMNGGKKVRTIDELRDNFELENMLNYYIDGTLSRWLKCQNYNAELTNLSKLNIESESFIKELYYSLGIIYKQDIKIDIKKFKEKNLKTKKLNEYIDSDNVKSIINKVAFSQEDLLQIIQEGKKIVYLYNGEYSINLNIHDIEYIGIGYPTVLINSDGIVNLDEKNIILRGLCVNSKNKIKIISNKSDIKYRENIVNLSIDVGMFTQIIQKNFYKIMKLDKRTIDYGIEVVREAKIDRKVDMIIQCGNLIRFLKRELENKPIINSNECRKILDFYNLEDTWNKGFCEKKIKEIEASNFKKFERFKREIKIIEEILTEVLKSKELAEKIK